MFQWSGDMISFMNDAARYTGYQDALADWICAQIPDARRVCDAGCGLGFLADRLAGRFEHVTAADISEQALSYLRARAEEENCENLQIVQADLLDYRPEAPFDAMVFCMFGRMEEILRMAKRCCTGTAVVIKKAYTHHRFSVGRIPLSDETAEPAAQVLKARGIPFAFEERKFDMGQPLASLSDAIRFFELHSKDAPGTLTETIIEQRLLRTDSEEFPFYLPQRKSLGRFTIRTADIPEEFV